MNISLSSDNSSSAHPTILNAVIQANHGNARSYGLDRWTEEAQIAICKEFKTDCKIFFVPTGTGANIFSLKLCCKPYESTICTEIAHIQYQETGAAEAIAHTKLLTVPHQNGKITIDELVKRIKKERTFGKHSTSPRLLSITQPTEIGTVYTLQELQAIRTACNEHNLLLHIDGSRFYNAAAYLNIDLSKLIEASQADILSLGGTKNGCIAAEAVLVFNQTLQEGSDYLHKQTLGLFSKMRYFSSQYKALFTDQLWRTLAIQANQKAQEIATILKKNPHVQLSHQVETNQIFFTLPHSWIHLIQEQISCYLWDAEKNEIRFITSWNTSDEEIQSIKLIFLNLGSL